MPSLSLLTALSATLLGVAHVTPKVRGPNILGRRGHAPPAPVVHKPMGLPVPPQPSSLPQQQPKSSSAAVAPPVVSNAASSLTNQLAGQDLISNPSVFRGLTAGTSWKNVEPPEPLDREEELELVRRALFFIASTNAQRALTERAKAAEAGGDAAADGAYEFHVFDHAAILEEMRSETERKKAARLEEARRIQFRKGGGGATEVPVDVPLDMSDVDFRLTIALGRAAYNKLFHHHQRLVYFEVNKLWPKWQRATVIEKADFLQEGAQGLLRAIRLFDTTRGVRFSTYASWHVRAFVLRALRDKSHLVRLPQTLQQDMAQIRKARYRYAVETQGHAPSDDALAEMLHWPAARVQSALQGLAAAAATSLDAGVGGMASSAQLEREEPMVARISSPKDTAYEAEQGVYGAQLKQTLSDAMAERDPRRIQITRLKYGLEDGVEWTYPQLAVRFNQTANVLKGIVRTEVNFLRAKKKMMLQDFANHM